MSEIHVTTDGLTDLARPLDSYQPVCDGLGWTARPGARLAL